MYSAKSGPWCILSILSDDECDIDSGGGRSYGNSCNFYLVCCEIKTALKNIAYY